MFSYLYVILGNTIDKYSTKINRSYQLILGTTWSNLASFTSRRGWRGSNHLRPYTYRNILPIISSSVKRNQQDKRNYIKTPNWNNLLNIQIHTSNSSPTSTNSTKKTRTNLPELFLSNTRSLVNKTDELSSTILSLNPDVAIITETWLTSYVTDDLISIPGYNVYRKDRNLDKRGDGVCLYLKNNMKHLPLHHLINSSWLETFWILLQPDRLPRGFSSIIFGAAYHPPNADDQILRQHLHQSLDSILADHPHSVIILAGDFNQFKSSITCSLFKLKNTVFQPTRANKIMDKMFVNIPQWYNQSEIIAPIGLSDHSSVVLKPCQKLKIPTEKVLRRRYTPSSIAAFQHDLDRLNWSPIYHTLPVNLNWTSLWLISTAWLIITSHLDHTDCIRLTNHGSLLRLKKWSTKDRKPGPPIINLPYLVNKSCKSAKKRYYQSKLNITLHHLHITGGRRSNNSLVPPKRNLPSTSYIRIKSWTASI
jgi:hypothetical protein